MQILYLSVLHALLLIASYPTIAKAEERPIFFEASVDHQDVFVQQQVLLTIKIFKEKNPPGIKFVGPNIDNAIVEKLTEDEIYSESIGDKKYLVREKNYAVFPQESGTLKIRNSMTTPNDKTIKEHSPQNWAYDGDRLPTELEQTIDINVRPQAIKAGESWLPSKEVSLKESGITEQTTWRVGVPVSWTISIEAQGLSENQLPDIMLPKTDGIEIYLESVSKSRKVDTLGIVGKKRFNFSLVPTRKGQLTLPRTSLKWWNTNRQSNEISIIRSRQIIVSQL